MSQNIGNSTTKYTVEKCGVRWQSIVSVKVMRQDSVPKIRLFARYYKIRRFQTVIEEMKDNLGV